MMTASIEQLLRLRFDKPWDPPQGDSLTPNLLPISEHAADPDGVAVDDPDDLD
jgi:hypothetical protein